MEYDGAGVLSGIREVLKQSFYCSEGALDQTIGKIRGLLPSQEDVNKDNDPRQHWPACPGCMQPMDNQRVSLIMEGGIHGHALYLKFSFSHSCTGGGSYERELTFDYSQLLVSLLKP